MCQSEKKVQLEAGVVILSIIAGALSRGVGVTLSHSWAEILLKLCQPVPEPGI